MFKSYKKFTPKIVQSSVQSKQFFTLDEISIQSDSQQSDVHFAEGYESLPDSVNFSDLSSDGILGDMDEAEIKLNKNRIEREKRYWEKMGKTIEKLSRNPVANIFTVTRTKEAKKNRKAQQAKLRQNEVISLLMKNETTQVGVPRKKPFQMSAIQEQLPIGQIDQPA